MIWAIAGGALAVLVVGFRFIPSRTSAIPPASTDTRLYHRPESPNLEGSKLFGIEKLHPGWSFGFRLPAPAGWKPSQPEWWRRASWHLRNPLYNYFSYVIGVADREHYRIGMRPLNSFWKDHKAAGFKCNLTCCGPFLWLPMLSWRWLGFESHLGWNERGKFGAALRARNAKDGVNANDGHDGHWAWF